MKQMTLKWSMAALAVSMLAIGGLGCAEEVEDIDRTQTNKLKKTQLAGHWYMLQTIIDVPYQSSAGFVGFTNYGNNPKVMFEITEHFVYVVPVTEAVKFAEAPYKLKKMRNYWEPGKSHEFVDMYVGESVAAFPVLSHFDVIRQYSPATGKQNNVLVENSTDRVWHEREFMRVDWSTNLIYDWAFPTGSYKFSPVDHYVQEGTDPYLAPEGAGKNPDLPEFTGDYISLVNKAFMPPSGRDWQGYSCSPYGISNKDCAGATVKIRTSWRRAPVNNDYETFLYTNGEHMDKFGFFLSTRYSYDELWNLTESKRDYKAQRWNLWQTTWDREDLTDDAGNTIPCRTDLDCKGDANVLDYTAHQCIKDDYFKIGKCQKGTLKQFKDRGLRPIVYHISAGFDAMGCPEGGNCMSDELSQVWYEAAHEWSAVFKSTVAWMMTLEEAGRYWTRSCKTNADCVTGREHSAGGDVLVDATIATPKQMPLHPEMGCPAESVAAGDQCLSGVGCDENDPCDMNQVCDSGVCFWKNDDDSKGAQVLNPVLVPGVQAATMVIHPKKDGTFGVIPVRDDYLGSKDDPKTNIKMASGECAIRFVNASEDTDAKLDGITDEMPYADGWVRQAYVTAAGDRELTVSVGGSKVATANLNLTQGYIYVAAFVNGDTLVVAGTQVNSGTGIRMLHAVPGVDAIDGGLTSWRAATNLAYGGLSDYDPSRYDEQRITALVAGSEGDITCYYTLHEGRCVGWAGEFESVDTLYQEKLAQLPEMFVICENQYDNAAEAWKYENATGAEDIDTVYHDGRYSTKGTNPYNSAGEQALSDPNAIFNPCEHFVKAPQDLKKIGDVRYNFMYWMGEPQASSPLGYGPSGGDPETGQLVWGNAYIYGAPTLTYGQWASDLVDMVNGELPADMVVSGQYIKDYVEAKGDPLPMDNSSGMYPGAVQELSHVHGTSPQDVFKTHGQFDAQGRVTGAFKDPFQIEELWDFMSDKNYRKALFSSVPTVDRSYAKNRMEKVRGTVLEDLMLNEEVRQGLTGGQLEPGTPLTAELRAKLSPANWAHSNHMMAEQNMRNRVMAEAPCTYDREFVDDHIYGIAKEFFCSEEERAQYKNDPASLGGKQCLTGDELRWELTRRIFGGVLEHEIGHTVSLRHNFAGSADVFNFFDEFYEVREKENVLCRATPHCDEDVGETCDEEIDCATAADCPGRLICNGGVCTDTAGETWGACALDNIWVTKFVPRTVHTPNERLNKITEYQYSTVMDYGGRFNSDIHGLGKYDYAAIKFGYGRLVDVYKDPSNMRNRMEQLAQRFGREPSYFAYLLSTDGWRYAGTIFHPFFYLENYIGVEENLSRSTAPYEKVKLEHAVQATYQDDRFYWSYVEVPYRFCSDEFRGNLGCYTWDTGIDIGEMIATAQSSIDEYYVFDAFKRERMYTGSDSIIFSYFGRVMSRFMAIMGDSARYFAIYDNIFNDRGWYPDHVANLYGMHTLATASRTSFNNLAQMLASPAPGSFVKDADGVYRNTTYDLDAEGTDLNIPLGVGKFPYTQWLGAENYGFQNHVMWVGSFWLKLGAMMTLTDSTFYSSSAWVGEQLEIGRASAVGFNTLYQREMTNLLGGVVAESLGAYSGVAVFDEETGEGTFKARDLFDPKVDEDADAIEPGIDGLNMKVWAGVLGLANLPAGFDPSFIDAMAVFVEGSGHEFDLVKGGAGVKIAKFNDPFGSKTYVGYQPNYDAGRLAPAFTIIKEAQDLRTQWESASGVARDELAAKMKQRIAILDVMRLMHSIYGNLEY